MNINEIKRLIKMVESSNIDELEIQEEGHQIRITKCKSGAAVPLPVSAPPVVHTTPHPIPQVHKEAIAQEVPRTDSASAKSEHLIEIRSPMVGTFYRAPAPDSQP